jgi:hypothetical protein
MARYIDADALLNKMPDDLPYKASVKRVLIQAPTADVAPKIEVDTELPCVAYNKKHERYQVIHKGKQGHIFASKLYRNRRDAEDALAELKKKYTGEQT